MASEYLTLGRGKVHFAPFAAGTQTPTGFDFFGNCPAFNLNVAVEELTHMDSTGGLKEEDQSVITSRTVGGSIQCDDMLPKNLARWFLGTASTVTQAAIAAPTDETFAAVTPGATYRVGISDAAPTGLKKITVTNVEDDEVTPNVFTAGTDYVVDSERGTIQIVDGGAITEGTNIIVSYTAATATYAQVISGQTDIEGALWFEAINAVGKNADYYLPYVKLRPEGDLALIGDDWISYSYTLRHLCRCSRSKPVS